MIAKQDEDCRLCKSRDLVEFLDLGVMPIADAFTIKSIRENPAYYFPLTVNLCRACGWHQLSHVVSPEVLYQRDYPYDSTVTTTGEEHWKEFAQTITNQYHLQPSDRVLDIGSNTGALLSQFAQLDSSVIGVDPSKTASDIANTRGIITINDFLNRNSCDEILRRGGKVKVATATNSFAHVDDLDDWLENVLSILDEDGVIIIESPHVLQLIRNNEYDTIYHEHLSYISVNPLVLFFEKFGLHITDVSIHPIHGGSIRIHIQRNSIGSSSNSVNALVQDEKANGIFSIDRLEVFRSKVNELKENLDEMLERISLSGKTIGIASAPAKGMTMINFLDFDKAKFLGISDKSPLKIGRFAPGTDLIVLSDLELATLKPDYILVLAWNFAKEIMQNYISISGYVPKFIIPVPVPAIV